MSQADRKPSLERLEEWLSASGSARREALASSLKRIREMDASVHAWVQVLPQPQLADGPLAGIPFAVKDVIDTRNLVTEYGSPLYRGRYGPEDAAIVQRLRDLGAILLGKTQTAAFAYRTPPPTRNPRNPEHTPGGSSSGSAAAVAAGMVPFAIGTQTLGSVLRPASYCGITGFKPSYGVLPMAGVLPCARSLDTLGFFTHTPKDLLLLWEALGHGRGEPEDIVLGVPDPPQEVDAEMANAFAAAVSALRRSGLDVRGVPITAVLDELDREARIVEHYEASRFHEARFREHGDRLLDLADLVRAGLEISDERYQDALRFIARSKEQMAAQFEQTPVILTPAATGPAPRGLASTGNARMNSPWTALGTPAVSIPMPVGSRLPLGMQLAAAPGQDGRVLQTAVRAAAVLDGPGY